MAESSHAAYPIVSGEWLTNGNMTDYRSEWLSSMLVERAIWKVGATRRTMVDVVIAAAGNLWFRFWLPDYQQVVEKYFTVDGDEIGILVPVCLPLERLAQGYQTIGLPLRIWLDPTGQVTVLGEEEFDIGLAAGHISPDQAEYAENHIRNLTTVLAQAQFPPALVRHFAVDPSALSGSS